jgi:hypothetical protein
MSTDNQETFEEAEPVSVDMSVIEAQNRAEVDIQISTANKYPRNLTKSLNNCIVAVTMDLEMAKSCKYSIKRGGKMVTGPSVHLAKLIASQYKNLRISSKITRNDGKNIYSEGVCFDLENNVAFKVEIPRKITDRDGKAFSEDMQTVTANAANSISMRNAILATVPRFFTDRVLKEVDAMIDGKLSDKAFFLQERARVFSTLKTKYGLSEERVLLACGQKTLEAIDKESMRLLIQLLQSLNDGDTTVEESFPLSDADKQAAYEDRLKKKAEAEAAKGQ